MNSVMAIFRRELNSYFATPLALVFIVIFLLLAAMFTFAFGGFYERGQADLMPFFQFHPFLYLFLVPALSMRMWAEERKTGTIELLISLPVTIGQAVIGKFLAAWVFTGIALMLTFPIWITVNYLGDPDNGVIVASYLGSFLMSGAFLSIGACLSALTRNQVIAFVLSIVVCLGFVLAGMPSMLNLLQLWAPQVIVDTVASMSFLSHYTSIIKGVIDLRDLVYFGLIISFWLYCNAVILDLRKSD
ncbi:MAG: ABC transporter permease [Pseudomonadota bacterium]